jgi:dTDP-4-amino-4,6-dideoxygalactose transaminase
MMVTQDEALAARLKRLRLHGGAREYHHDEVGTNSRLDTVQAAILKAKLPFLSRWSEARRNRAARYTAAFQGHAAITPPHTDPANEHIFHQYTIEVSDRDKLSAHLKEKGIGNKVYYPVGLHLQPCFANLGYQRGELPLTEAAMERVISLPIFPELTDAQQDAVISAVKGFYA